jgi:uncharacterized protein (DUF427 family)
VDLRGKLDGRRTDRNVASRIPVGSRITDRLRKDPIVADKIVKQPGPDHPITVTPDTSRVTVTAGGRLLADSTHVLRLQESTYPPRYYFPLADVDTSRLVATDHYTYCPFKGDCSYYSITGIGDQGTNAVWTYRAPHPAVAEIADHVAFYPDRVQIEVG